MTKERIYLYDTTLRDGVQTLGVLFGFEDKIRLTKELDDIGIDYIEGGFTGANETDRQYFENLPATNSAKITAFGMTKRADHSAENDNNLASLVNSKTNTVCIVGKAHVFHVQKALGISLEKNFENIGQSIRHLVAKGKEVIFDAEHFFDGYFADEKYALECVKEAYNAGARWVVLCDTNGGTLPRDIGTATKAVIEYGIPGDRLGIHTHNDTENAVGGSLAAIDAGARHVQGTINGIGERCGNANLITILGNLRLKEPYRSLYDTGVSLEKLKKLTHLSRILDDILDRIPSKNAAYVGTSAFAHKAGLHGSGVLRDPSTYEHVDPEDIGNKRIMPLSNQAGRSHVRSWLKELGVDMGTIDDGTLSMIVREIKLREDKGYTYDVAPESCQLLVKRLLGTLANYFTVQRFRVNVESHHLTDNVSKSESEAVVVIKIGNERKISVSEGLTDNLDSGPVHALSKALQRDLGPYQKFISDMKLVDFKVRIRGSGTSAVTRVVIESTNSEGLRWATAGVSPNIIEASFEALVEAIIWKLDHDCAPTAEQLVSEPISNINDTSEKRDSVLTLA